jgi:D-alanyl-D-alanine carboxypeptidase/D-alanyl-D-alanine-endopeptidase (penicillin-binding protein 4)
LNFKFCNFKSASRLGYIVKRLPLLLLVFGLACAAPTKLNKASQKSIEKLRYQIDAILQDSTLHQTRTGIKVVSLTTGEVLYAKDSQLLFHPASNMKLLTTAAALSKLGPDFRFKTILYADTSSFADSTIFGNLYLKGFANPSLTTQDLWWMVRQLKEMGVTKITGDLICDQSYLDDLYYGAGWMWDDASDRDFAPIGALSVNHNSVTIKVQPASEIGDSLIVQLDPPTSYMKIANYGVTVDSTDTTRLKAFKVERKWRERENTVVVEGGLTPQTKQEEFVIEVVEPALYLGTLLAEIMASEHIEFSGNILKEVIPSACVELVKHSSPPLSTLIIHTNKETSNLYAELILKTLGAEIRGNPGTAEKGLSVIKLFFHEFGVDTTSFELADGSGVSRYNVIAPDQIIELLKAVHKDFRVQAEFKASLPIAGVDGTLKNRMKNTPAAGKLRAKTGTLRGVSTLSGYTTTADGEPLAFSMMMEHFVVPTSKIREIQDRIGAVISGFHRKVVTKAIEYSE